MCKARTVSLLPSRSLEGEGGGRYLGYDIGMHKHIHMHIHIHIHIHTHKHDCFPLTMMMMMMIMMMIYVLPASGELRYSKIKKKKKL